MSLRITTFISIIRTPPYVTGKKILSLAQSEAIVCFMAPELAALQLAAIREAAITARENSRKQRNREYLQNRYSQWRLEEKLLHQKIEEKRQLDSLQWQTRLEEQRVLAEAQAAMDAQRDAAIATKIGAWQGRISAFIGLSKSLAEERKEAVAAGINEAKMRRRSSDFERRGAQTRRRSQETELEMRRAEVAEKKETERLKKEMAKVRELKKDGGLRRFL